ncbi:MAG: NAD(P)-dependent oxidoreductase, partial [Verrucomicrobiota bacterium]
LRKLPQWQPIMSSSGKEHDDQKDHMMTRSLYRKKVGIHGFGNVARTLFSLMKPFQVECFVYSKNVPHDFIREHGAIPCENLKELFSKSEILAECEALTPETEGSVTKEILHCLPHDAVFVNVGRGAVVDESALAQLALEEKIFVGSDVFCKEPLPHDSPFFKTRRALLSPHIAGPTLDSLPDCAKKAFENLKNFIDGKPLKNQLTLEGFDRAT